MDRARPVVLVIEHEPPMVELLEMLLAELGCVAELAASGGTARAWLGAYRPDLVICRTGLPDLDAYVVPQLLDADDLTRGVPVLICSARDGARVRAEFAALVGSRPHTAFLLKPFDIDEFWATVTALCPFIVEREQAGQR